jgi:hypothetical protein
MHERVSCNADKQGAALFRAHLLKRRSVTASMVRGASISASDGPAHTPKPSQPLHSPRSLQSRVRDRSEGYKDLAYSAAASRETIAG